MFSSFVTVILIVKYFSPEVQGYYYTFSSFLALQAFVDLGIGNVIIYFASHEWAKLSLDQEGRVVGDDISLSRLADLLKLVIKWYAAASIIILFGLGILGCVFFSKTPYSGIDWLSPWIFLSITTALNFLVQGILLLLEGCNQVSFVYRYRLIFSLLGSIFLWVSIFLGAELWILAIQMAVGIIVAIVMVLSKYFHFFRSLLLTSSEETINWKKEILPFQGKLAISFAFAYFFTNGLYNPVMFKYQGAVVAGQMGLSLSIANSMAMIGYSLIQPQIPRLGIFLSQQKYVELDKFFLRLNISALGVSFFACSAAYVILHYLHQIGFAYSIRLLHPSLVGVLLFIGLLRVFGQLQGAYMRAHKKEPYMWLSVIEGLLIGLAIWFFGSRYGATGAVAGTLIVNIFIVLPFSTMIFLNKRNEWHNFGGLMK